MEKGTDEQLKSELSFDLYGRYAIIRNLINNNRKVGEKFRVLDVGGQGNLLKRFLPNDDVFYLDPLMDSDDKNFIKDDGCAMSLEDGSFDWVTSADVFEHIPEEKRKAFLSENIRVARLGTILAAPFWSKEVEQAEINANENYKKFYNGQDNKWLKEHIENGLPKEIEIETFLRNKDFNFQKINNNRLFLWETIIGINFFVWNNFSKQMKENLGIFNYFYNSEVFPYDSINPSYRKIYFIKKQNSLKNLEVNNKTIDDVLFLETIKKGIDLIAEIDVESRKSIQSNKQIIQEKDLDIQTKDQQINSKEFEIQSKIQEIEWMKSSKFWKIKTFYEKVKSPIFRFVGLIKKAFFVLKRDGFLIFLKKVYNKLFIVIKTLYITEKSRFLLREIKEIPKMGKKRILFINHEESNTGAPKVLLDIIQKEIEIGEFDCWIVSLTVGDNPWNLKQLLCLDDVPGLNYEKKVQYILKKLVPDIVYANTIVSCEFASYFPCKKIASIHEFRSLISFLNTRNIQLLKGFDIIIAVCEPAEKLLRKWGIKAVVLPYYLNSNYLRDISINTALNKEYIIGIGLVQLRKGLHRFLELAKLMPDKKFVWIGALSGDSIIKNNFLILKGSSSLLSDYVLGEPVKDVVLKLPIPKNVTFTGLVDSRKLFEFWMPRTTCLLMLSTDDPFPLVVTEGKFFNLNVVTLKESGDSYKICDEHDLVLDIYDKKKIIKYLQNLIPNERKLNESVCLWFNNNFEVQRNLYIDLLKPVRTNNVYTPIIQKVDFNLVPRKVAIVAHVYQEDLIDELIRYISNISFPCKIFISTRHEIKNFVEQKFTKTFGINNVVVSVVQNRGRDVAPFVVTFRNVYKDFDYVCKIHTKKSLHLELESGNGWRNYLLDNLLGTKDIINTILLHFESDPKIGIIYPDNYFKLNLFSELIGPNIKKVLNLCKRMNVSFEIGDEINYASGTMFWFRPKALQPIFDLNFTFEDFEPEEMRHEADGYLDHAIERLPCPVARKQGFYTENILFTQKNYL